MGTEGIYLNRTKTAYNKPTINIILKGENSKHILQDLLMSLLPIWPNIDLESVVTAIKEEKKINPNWKEKVILSLFADNTENPTDATRKLRELINESG